MKDVYLVERFRELDSIEKIVFILVAVMFIYVSVMIIYELIDMHKMRRGYIVDKSFLKMEERCGEKFEKDVKITVNHHYVTNYICDIGPKSNETKTQR